jgi:hypothetical protein
MPFTPGEFMELLARYNQAVWPLLPILPAGTPSPNITESFQPAGHGVR